MTAEKKVGSKLADRSQGSYIVCHFNSVGCTEEPLEDDPPHRIEGAEYG